MKELPDEKPPFFKSWNSWYLLVIGFLGSAYNFILLFYQTFFMSLIDWIVLIVTLVGIILYGLYKSRSEKNLESYFLLNRSSSWYLILLGIIGTQASAVTFLSAPGQAYTDGMRFVQYYFGLPLGHGRALYHVCSGIS